MKQLCPLNVCWHSPYSMQIHAAEDTGEISVSFQSRVMTQQPKAKDATSVSESESWIKLSSFFFFIFSFWLEVMFLFFLFLPLSVSLNPSTGAKERERRKEKSFTLRCCVSCWDFIKSCLRSHLCLVDVLILEQIVKSLINLN